MHSEADKEEPVSPHCCGATPGCIPKAWRQSGHRCLLSLSPHLAGLASGDEGRIGEFLGPTLPCWRPRPGTHVGRAPSKARSPGASRLRKGPHPPHPNAAPAGALSPRGLRTHCEEGASRSAGGPASLPQSLPPRAAPCARQAPGSQRSGEVHRQGHEAPGPVCKRQGDGGRQ